jgi:hypothetical protein
MLRLWLFLSIAYVASALLTHRHVCGLFVSRAHQQQQQRSLYSPHAFMASLDDSFVAPTANWYRMSGDCLG